MAPTEDSDCSKGVVYVVAGSKNYVGELITSVKSLRSHNKGLSITVFTNFEIPDRLDVTVRSLEFLDNPHKLKVCSLRRSPYERTLFLDTDTQIRGTLDPLFDELDFKDFCAANSHLADYSVRPPRFINMKKVGGYNTGVLLFRKCHATEAFLKLWEEAVCAHDSSNMWAGHFGDQYFFNDLVSNGKAQATGVRWGVLDNLRWNCRGIARSHVVSLGRWPEVVILHERSKTMKLRKLFLAVTHLATAKVIVGKGRRALGNLFARPKSC